MSRSHLQLLQLASQDAVVRLKASKLNESNLCAVNKIISTYFEGQKHSCLVEFLQHYLQPDNYQQETYVITVPVLQKMKQAKQGALLQVHI